MTMPNAEKTLGRAIARCVIFGSLLVPVAGDVPAWAQAPSAATRPSVTIDLPPEVEVKHLIDLVTKRLELKIIYDNEQVANKRVTIHCSGEMTEDVLLPMLQSALQTKQLALVDGGAPGWKKIVPVQGLAAMVPVADASAAPRTDGEPLTQLFVLNHGDAGRAVELVRPFLTQPGGNVVGVGGTRYLVVSDFAPAMARIAKVLKWMDSESPDSEIRFIKLQRSDASAAAPVLQNYLMGKERAMGGTGDTLFVSADSRGNQVVVAGPRGMAAAAEEFLKQLDQAEDATLRVYRFQSASPEQVDRLFRAVLGQGSNRQAYRAGIDANSGTLAVLASTEIHEQLDSLVKQVDVPTQQSPIRFYKLRNTVAADVLDTIAGLQESTGTGELAGVTGPSQGETPYGSETSGTGAASMTPSLAPGQAANAPAVPSSAPAPPQVSSTPASPSGQRSASSPPTAQSAVTEGNGASAAVTSSSSNGHGSDDFGNSGWDTGERNRRRLRTGPVRTAAATITADVNTNSIIVMASPAIQKVYEDLVTRLDQRRAQVLIECTILSVDTTDDFRFGVEVAGRGTFGSNGRVLGFSSFGLSDVTRTGHIDPVSGATGGGNLAILSPREADIVIKALASNTRGRLLSVPQLLVNDNETGRLKSKLKVFYAQLNQYNTGGSSTTVGGDVDAGTEVRITPHISEDDYLQLVYSLELSRFDGSQKASGLPPSILTNNVDSAVTIPDGYTIVVGGLTLQDSMKVHDAVPLLGEIPVLEYFFSSRSSSTRDATLFVFIRPVILRDDRFRDLRFLSNQKLDEAAVPQSFPASEPAIMW
jgi:general secretion pathway protein D